MKKISFFSIMLLLMFVIGCQNQNTPIETTDSSNTPLNTTIPTITLTPAKSPTLVSIASPTQTLSIQFPEWVKNPNTQILLIPVGTRETGYENMALYNAETGERFDVPFTEEVGDYFWMPDGSQFGFLPPKLNQITLYSITKETINIIQISEESLRFFPRQAIDLPDSIEASNSNVTDPAFLLLSPWDSLSPDRKYFIYQEKYDETYTSIFDIAANETVNISDPDDEYFDLYSEWSPTSSLLAIVEVDETPEMFNTFQTLPTFRLRVYDVQSQQVVASYKNVTIPIWSPDGTNFLFQEWKKSEHGWYGHFSSPPCVYDAIYGTTNCYYETLTDNDREFSSLDWSPDQSMISYVYNDQGLCTIILSTKAIQCILSKGVLEDNYIRQYSWSPDSSFISFEFDSVGPYSDDNDNPRLGIGNVKTGKYFSIGENINMHHLGLWRPLSNP